MSSKSSNTINDILFQKMGATWYAFTEVDGEVIYAALPEGCDPHGQRMEFYQVLEGQLAEQVKSMRRSPDMSAA
ncbi:MAG: hypothetical protein HN353_08840 [Bdellovibrionales bacterium]|jgi:hypothetical protein|nr:hypothetical protein [Bdellovibrionales bacterium]MBT3526928.1 hypothetical protein [Bdellovibrionales bacterium]MBT7669392.1 hypothetical protein [Bdellovibrionales bacterium]